MTNILRIDASMRTAGSTTRGLTDRVIEKLASHGPTNITTRDLTSGISFIDEDWINANFTDPDARTVTQQEALAGSDALVGELQAADVIVIGVPIYNFGVPAALKAWIDQVARARLTFKYTENGPVGLLEGKRAIIALASGGTEMGSAIDFATPYLRHVFGFIGIHNVEVVAADRQMADLDAANSRADALLEAV